MNKDRQYEPFEIDPEYLDAEFEWMKARAERLSLQKRLASLPHTINKEDQTRIGEVERVEREEIQRRLKEAQEIEENIRNEVDSRIDLTRHEYGPDHLAIDCIQRKYKLDDHERQFLLVSCLPCVSQEITEDVFKDLNFFTQMSVEELIRFVIEPVHVEEWLNGRSYFETDGRLLQNKLITLEYYVTENTPDALLRAQVRLTMNCFRKIIGLDQDFQSIGNED